LQVPGQGNIVVEIETNPMESTKEEDLFVAPNNETKNKYDPVIFVSWLTL
jgi:hypothetical protein